MRGRENAHGEKRRGQWYEERGRVKEIRRIRVGDDMKKRDKEKEEMRSREEKERKEEKRYWRKGSGTEN